jgi:hypothetical protein
MTRHAHHACSAFPVLTGVSDVRLHRQWVGASAGPRTDRDTLRFQMLTRTGLRNARCKSHSHMNMNMEVKMHCTIQPITLHTTMHSLYLALSTTPHLSRLPLPCADGATDQRRPHHLAHRTMGTLGSVCVQLGAAGWTRPVSATPTQQSCSRPLCTHDITASRFDILPPPF